MSGDKFRISQCDVEKKKCNPSSENSTMEQCYCWLNGGDHLDLPEWGGRVGGSAVYRCFYCWWCELVNS